MATIYKRKADGKGSHWYFGYMDENGRQRTRKGYTDRKATAELAAQLEKDARRKRDGLIDPAAERLADQRKSSIDAMVEAYEVSLTGRKTTGKHVSLTLSRVRKVVEGCGFKILSEIETERVQTYLNTTREAEDWGHRTYNHYVQAVEGFGNWLVSSKRTVMNPMGGLTRLNNEVDVRHKRRALSVEEVGQLIESARTSGQDIQCFTPEERARIYSISCLTGLRRKEIASLTPRSFALTADPPTVTVQAACSKHRRTDVLPLHLQLIELLPQWIRGLPLDQPIFPKLANRRTWLMVKLDLQRAGIPYETSEGIADFHAAGRHTFITGLLKNGATLPETKELARHSDVNMTMRYAHIGIQDRAKAVAGLPFQEYHRSKSLTAPGHRESSSDTDGPPGSDSNETTNPGSNRGYVILCLPQSSNDVGWENWRRRESNPRPENRQVGPLRV